MTTPADASPLVLVVDDEPDIVQITCGCLEMRGFRTISAASGKEALASASRDKPDVMLVDILMPGMDGLSVIRACREDDRLRRLPIVVLSALVDAERVIACFDAGADDYVIKPPEFDEVAARLRRLVRTAHEAGEPAPAPPPSSIPEAPAPDERLQTLEAAIKQIALAAQLARERKDSDFQMQCLERIQGFCTFAIKVLRVPGT